jgi:hypothetical protein
MKIYTWIEIVLGVLSLVYILINQYGSGQPERMEHYVVTAILMGGAIWVFLDFLKLKRDILGKDKFREFISTKKDILIYIIFGIIIGYFWGHAGKKAPHEVWLDDNKYIEVVQKPRGSVYTFVPIGDGNYQFVSVNKQRNKGK